MCEADIVQQPIISRFPDGKISLPKNAVSQRCPYVDDCDGFDRVTQAVWLLDQVFKASEEREIDVRLAQFNKLDYSLRGCLALTMDQSKGRWGLFCTANAIIFRYG